MSLSGKIKFEPKASRRFFQQCPQCGSEWPASAETCRRCAIGLGSTPRTEELKWYVPANSFFIYPGSLPRGIYEITAVTIAVCQSIYAMSSDCPEILTRAARKILEWGGILTRSPGGHLTGCFHGKNLIEAADRAVRFGLAMQSEPEKYGRRIFVGINTGPVLVDRSLPGGGGEVSGDVMVCSAAISLSVHPGMVVVSPSTFRLVASRFDCYGTVPVDLWGKYEEVPRTVYVVTGSKPAKSWRDRLDENSGPFFGREKELEFLHRHWQETKSGKRPEGLTVHLVGEPGSGKSKILQAFLSKLRQDDPHAALIRLAGSNYGGQPGLLLKEFMTECAKESIAHAKPTPRMSRPRCAPFPTRFPKTLGARIKLAFRLLAELHRDRPTLIVIDDLHWADRESILAFGKAWISLPAGIMVLASYRPSGSSLGKFLTGRNTQKLFLGPLSETEARQISQFHSPNEKAISPALWRQIWEKSGGNPLYTEEATKFILARGEDSISKTILPTTRAGLILARIKDWADRELAEMRKELYLRWGGSIQSRLSKFETQINDWLDRLETQNYLERTELSECLEELERLQNRIVELCLVKGLARPLTTRLGEVLFRLYEGSYRDHYRHLLRSSRVPENRSGVGNQALQVAKRAVDMGRLREAVGFFRLAEKMLPSNHPLIEDLLRNSANANLMLGRTGEAARLYKKAFTGKGVCNPHDDTAHMLLLTQVLNGKSLEVTSCEWRKELCPWHLIGMSLEALLSENFDTAVAIARRAKTLSKDWVARTWAGLIGAFAQFSKGNHGETLAICTDVSRGMQAGGLSVLSLGLHWILSQVTEGSSRSKHAGTYRFIKIHLGLSAGLRAFLARFDFIKDRGTPQ